MNAEEPWWRRRPYLRDFVFSLLAAGIGLFFDVVLERESSLTEALPTRLIHFAVVLTALWAIEWGIQRWNASRD